LYTAQQQFEIYAKKFIMVKTFIIHLRFIKKRQ